MFILFLLASLLSSTPQTTLRTTEPEDQEKVENATITWADSTFAKHEDYKFSYFKAFENDDYFIHEMRISLYEEKIEALQKRKTNGNFDGSEEDFEKELKTLEEALHNAKSSENKATRIDHFITHFWTNINTNDGISVYYEIIVRLDGNYKVIEAIENSSIGKKRGKSSIQYASSSELIKVVEKD